MNILKVYSPLEGESAREACRRGVAIFAVIGLALLVNIAHAAPTVIFEDKDKMLPMSDYYQAPDMEAISKELQNAADSAARNFQPPANPAAALLPVKTPEMSIGREKPRPLPEAGKYLNTPIFIIGSDATSQKWLSKNREYLKQHNFFGILVQVDTEQELKIIQEAGAGLSIVPAPGSELAKQLGLKHYPVAIVDGKIQQ